MTLFTKIDCRLCDQIKTKFDLAAMDVNIEVLDNDNVDALAHLAWHGLVEVARKKLPILVLDDCSSISDYTFIEKLLHDKADQCGIRVAGADGNASCESGACAL